MNMSKCKNGYSIVKKNKSRVALGLKEFKFKPIIETIQTDQLKWFGHVMRRDEKTTAKKVLDLKVTWKRPRGRTANILAKVHRQHSERKGNKLKRSRR